MLVYAGPFPETSQSNTHVLIVTDYFTKWIEAVPLQKKDALSVAKALATIFYRWALLFLIKLQLCSEIRDALETVLKYLSTRWFSRRAGTLLQDRLCSAPLLLSTESLGTACYSLISSGKEKET